MFRRDVVFSHAITVDVDAELESFVEEEHITKKANDVLTMELGDAAQWFEHASTIGRTATYELLVKDAYETDVSIDDALESALEFAVKMFHAVGSPFDPDDLQFERIETPGDTAVSSEAHTDTATDTGNGNDTDNGPVDSITHPVGGRT